MGGGTRDGQQPHIRPVLEQALAAVRQAEAALVAALDGPAQPERRVGAKEAADIWCVTEDAARKRLKRIGTLDIDGRWRAPISAVEAARCLVQAM